MWLGWSRVSEYPVHLLAVPLLEIGDGGVVLEGELDVVEPVQEAVLREFVDLEGILLAVRPGDGLRREIDGDLRARPLVDLPAQLVAVGLRQAYRQHAVLQLVVVVDVAEARRDDRADAEGRERLHGRSEETRLKSSH